MKEGYREVPDVSDRFPDKTVVSEDEVREFCKLCDALGSDNICIGLLDGYNEQADFVARRHCYGATVAGIRGELKNGEFSAHEWMRAILEEEKEVVTEDVVELANSVSEEEILQAKQLVEAEFRDWLIKDGRDLENLTDCDYQAFYANFACILPGHREGRQIKEHLEEIGKLDEPIGKNEKNKWDLHSELYLSQSWRQFMGVIYAAIRAEGLNVEYFYRYLGFVPYKGDQVRLVMEYGGKAVLARLYALGYIYEDLCLWH
jgi:hypothetical protein